MSNKNKPPLSVIGSASSRFSTPAPALDTPQPDVIAKASDKANAIDTVDASEEIATRTEGQTLYASRNHEPVKFNIQVANTLIRPSRDSKGERLIWSVPDGLAGRFESHAFFIQGRIIKV